MRILITIVVVSGILVGLGWVATRVAPAPFASYSKAAGAPATLPLPADLPAPVERFYRRVYGDAVPIIDSAVISGRASLRLEGVTLPSRFRFTHETGRSYRHYLESTLFGVPILKVNEWYVDGNSRLELPFGVVDGEPKVDQAANLGLWAEGIWFPAVFLTDPRVRWESVDEVTALLVVPYGSGSERVLVRFDPDTGLITLVEAMRYREADSAAKILWLSEVLEWGEVDGYTLPVRASLTWLDERTPWATWTVEEVVYNADVGADVRARGL